MARLPRAVLPLVGGVHAFSRTIRWERLFVTERDGYAFLFRAALAFERFDLECRTYALMPNHFHFLLHGRRDDVSLAMHWLLGGYARWFNRENGFRGHLFGDRYGTREITDADHELRVARYIVLNPVEAGLATHPQRWKWSSYRATVGSDQVPSFLSLAWLDSVMSRSAFASFVEAGLAELDAAA